MRKDDLIKMLSEIDGNPEVMVWNGYAQDYMPTTKESVTVDKLYKHNFEWYRCARTKGGRIDIDESVLIAEYKKEGYDQPNPFYLEDDMKHVYTNRPKTIIVISPGMANKSAYDRYGKIGY